MPLLVLDTTFCLDTQSVTGTLISLMYYTAGEKEVRRRHDGDAMMESVDRESGGIQIQCENQQPMLLRTFIHGHSSMEKGMPSSIYASS